MRCLLTCTMAEIFCFVLIATFLFSGGSGDDCTTTAEQDGWTLLQNGTVLQQTIRNYDNTHNTTTCPKVTTVARDGDRRQVTEKLEYLNRTSAQWMSFNSTFQFYKESSERYNLMNTTERSGGLPASYRFLYVDRNCTVMELVSVKYISSTLQSPGTATKSALCGLWVKPDAIGTESPACNATFYEKCNNTGVYSVYSETECTQQAPTQ